MKKIIIGTFISKQQLLSVLKKIILCLIVFFGGIYFLAGVETFVILLVLFAMMIPLICFFARLCLSSGVRLEVSEKEIAYYNQSQLGLIKLLRNAWHEHQDSPELCLRTEALAKVKLSYQLFGQTMALPGARLVLNFLMKDGTMYQLNCKHMASKEGAYLKALQLLEDKGIEIVDKDHLRAGLKKDQAAFQEYVLKIDKEKLRDD